MTASGEATLDNTGLGSVGVQDFAAEGDVVLQPVHSFCSHAWYHRTRVDWFWSF